MVAVGGAGSSAERMQGDGVDTEGDDEAVPADEGELQDGSVSKESYRRMRSSTTAGSVIGKMEGAVEKSGLAGCDGGGEVAKGKTLIKNNVTGDIDTTTSSIQTLISFMHVTISKKDTLSRAKLEFPIVVWPEIRPTSTSESTKESIVWFLIPQTGKRWNF